jgi:general nucleoside transport system permease protein
VNRFLSFAFLAQCMRISLPYLAAAMGGVLSERAGVVNVALEGTMLVGALFAVLGTTAFGSPWAGLLVALLAGVALQLLHAVAVLYGRANAIVSGIALNLLAAGGTRFLLRAAYDSASNSPAIAGLAGASKNQSLLVATLLDPATWLVVALVTATIVVLRSTAFGLRVRAVGEHPAAAASVGVSVARTRVVAVGLAGAAAGLGGAWLAFDQHQFSSGMSGGRGFSALAAVVISGWRPGRAALFCFLFGAADAAQIALQDQHVVSHHLVQMLPYLATLLALAGLVGRSRPPAALGDRVTARAE